METLGRYEPIIRMSIVAMPLLIASEYSITPCGGDTSSTFALSYVDPQYESTGTVLYVTAQLLIAIEDVIFTLIRCDGKIPLIRPQYHLHYFHLFQYTVLHHPRRQETSIVKTPTFLFRRVNADLLSPLTLPWPTLHEGTAGNEWADLDIFTIHAISTFANELLRILYLILYCFLVPFLEKS